MRKLIYAAAVAGVLMAGTGPAAAADPEDDRFALGIGSGLLGLGLDASHAVNDKLTFRANLNYARYEMPTLLSLATRIAGIPYDYDLRLLTVGGLADYHLLGSSRSGNGLILTGGFYYNANRFDLVFTPVFGATTRIGLNDYSDAQVGTLTDELTFRNTFAPYLGIGAETNFFSELPVSVYTRFGLLFQGPVDATLTASGGGVSPADIALEEKETEDSLSFIEVLPVFVMGMKIRF